MPPALVNAWRQRPITTACLAVAVGLSLAVNLLGSLLFKGTKDALWKLGAVVELEAVSMKGPLWKQPLTGLLDLWDGELWRIPVSAFHHGGLWHLLLNCGAIWFLGRLLEPRMRPFAFANFVLLAALVSMLPEFLLQHGAVGLSGVGYAMFGVLLVIRRHDDELRAELSEGIVQLFFVWLVGCVALTQLELVNVANAAHFAGLAYGWLIGLVYFSGKSTRRGWRMLFPAGHIVLLPALWLVSHPFWEGRYHWYLANRATTTDQELLHLSEAIAWNPGLPVPWRILADAQRKNGDPLGAWKTMVTGLSYNRSDEQGAALCRNLWNQLRTVAERRQALEILAQTFHEEEVAWQQRLGAHSPPGSRLADSAIAASDADGDDNADPSNRYALDRRVDLPPAPDGSDRLQHRELEAPVVDPDSPHSAARDMSVTL